MSLKVRTKLVMLSSLAMAGIAILAVSSQVEMARVFTAASYANDNTVPSLVVLDDAANALAVGGMRFWQSLAQSDPTAAARLTRESIETRAKIEAAFRAYEPLISDDKDKGMLAADRAAFGAFNALSDKALALAAENRKSEARDLMMQNQAVAQGTIDTIEAHRQYNKELGAGGATEAGRVMATARIVEIAIGVLASVLVIGVAYFVVRGLTRALSQAVKVLQEIERGNYESPVAILSLDETGQVLTSLDTMQRSLKERTDRDRERAESERARVESELAAAAENLRIRVALDRVSVGVMLADLDGKIIYANDFGTNIFRTRAAEIRKQLPQFDSERIIGSSFDAFHQVPTQARNMLAGLTGTHSLDIKLGAASLRAVFNPVVDKEGKRLGSVVQWTDRTLEVAIEEEIEATVAGAVDGNMTVRIGEEGKDGFFKTLAVGMNRLVGNMADVLRSITAAAAEVGTGAEEISRGNANLSQRTEEQASSLEETASSMEEMTSGVKSNADNAAQASQLALAARDQAERGGSVVQSAVAAMNEINSSSKRIADIIGVIDAIAFQTNLLALNAAVEAARAGEQGRGFAVVASEVRNLASRSAAAAKEIKELIGESVAKVDDGARLVDESGRVLNEIVAGVKKVTDVVAEIAAASQEQASGIEQVNKAVMQMDEVTQQNAALVEEATAAAQSLSEQAASLRQVMARFQVGGESISPARTPSVDRRGPNRAWSKPETDPGLKSVVKPAAAKKAAGGSDDSWEQF